MSGTTCQFMAEWMLCGRPATTKRLRPSGSGSWDVCAAHAAFLDRLRANITKHAELLRKLAER